MSEFKSSNFRNEDGSGGPDIVGLTTFTSPYYFVPPSGTTAERPSDPAPGMLRFNEDIGRLEVWRNDHWATILGESPNLGDQNNTDSTGGTGTRGFQAGGYGGSPAARRNEIDYITIETLGNSRDFGDLTAAEYGGKCCASRTRGLTGGGSRSPSSANTIDYITIASTGNAIDFGDRTTTSGSEVASSFSNQTRGVFCAGSTSLNTIDYVTIAQTGNAVDFGDLTVSRGHSNGCSSSVRGVTFGGEGSPAYVDTIDYVTIATTGNAQDFGNLSAGRRGVAAVSNAIRGISAGGDSNPANAKVTTIEFITLSTLGDAQDFGDLTVARGESFAGMCSPIRGVFGSGQPKTTDMDYISIQTTGNAIDFGDTTQYANRGGSSNGHGGL